MSVQTPGKSKVRNRTANTVSVVTSSLPADTAWTRPADWLELPTVTVSDQKFVGLFAVFPGAGNFATIRAQTSAGTYTVDWGDGTTTTHASNAYAYHQFVYTNAALDGTLTTQGYKQAIVTVTANTGNLTFFRCDEKHNQAGLNNYTNGWLDISIAGSYLSYVGIAQAQNPLPRMLQQAKIYKVSDTTCTDYTYMFVGAMALRSVPVLYVGDAVTSMTGMFQSCWALTETPTIDFNNVQAINSMFNDCKNLLRADISPAYASNFDNVFTECYRLVDAVIRDAGSSASSVVHLNSTFHNCYSLVNAEIYKTSNIDSMQDTFNYCRALKTLKLDPNTAILTNTTRMFTQCNSMTTIPLFDTSNVISMEDMFGWCCSLLEAPLLDTSSCINMQSMFDNCPSLRYLPMYNTSLVTNMYGLLVSCYSLLEFPNWDLSSVESCQYMFYSCMALKNLSTLDLPSALYASHMFDNVGSLASVTVNFGSGILTMDSMFSGATNINDVTINGTFPALTSVNSMFVYNYSLRVAPLFDTSHVTDFGSMFYQAHSLTDVPLYNTGNGTEFGSMFRHCYSLQKLPTFNTSNGTSFGYWVESCVLLVAIPPCNFNNGTNFDNFASSCYSLKIIPPIDLTNSTYTGAMFGSCYGLQTAGNITHAHTTIAFDTSQHGNVSLNEIYTNLDTVSGKTVYVQTNWGTTTDTPSIATAKGWTVYG
jgi:hypothetical protein